jgi:hypothetical protein
LLSSDLSSTRKPGTIELHARKEDGMDEPIDPQDRRMETSRRKARRTGIRASTPAMAEGTPEAKTDGDAVKPFGG